MRVAVALAVLALAGGAGVTAWAQWVLDGAPICTAQDDQEECRIVSGDSSNAIITWADRRSGSWDIYAQRVNSSGVAQWTDDGAPVCNANGDQLNPHIVSDGSSGAIIVWEDSRTGGRSIYAQRVNCLGETQWDFDGVAMCAASDSQAFAGLISDGSGGAIVTWTDNRTGEDQVYAQRIDFSGVIQWNTDGVVTCTTALEQSHSSIAPDGSGGAIIAWDDHRLDCSIYAQRIDSAGALAWSPEGAAVCTTLGDQDVTGIVSDGFGGAIITWIIYDGWSIYAGRISHTGIIQWGDQGIKVCSTAVGRSSYAVASDDSGGAIITWQDKRAGNYYTFAQRVNLSGVLRWMTNGVPVCVFGDQSDVGIVPDGDGGVVITWTDSRSGDSTDVYAQRLDPNGTAWWPTNGVPVCAAAGTQHSPALAPDGLAGGVFAWPDRRTGTSTDIYAQRVDSFGQVGFEEGVESEAPSSIDAPPSPNPFVCWTSFKGYEKNAVMVYDLCGRKIGEYPGDKVGANLASGIYFVSVSGSGVCKIVKVK
jgi:hypothetical protein